MIEPAVGRPDTLDDCRASTVSDHLERSHMQTAFLRNPTAALVLADGTAFLGHGIGAPGTSHGELVFNTAMTGYQEIISDPSYAGQIITFTFPHIGNVGINAEDVEAPAVHARGLVMRAAVTAPSNWRSQAHLATWLAENGIAAITGVDTRRITKHLRDQGAQNAVLAFAPEGAIDIEALRSQARAVPSMEGQDLAPDVTRDDRPAWNEGDWSLVGGYASGTADGPHIVVIDYGVKNNIMRLLAARGCRVTSTTAQVSVDALRALEPDGVVLANGPGDPAATGTYAVDEIRKLLDDGTPIFGICLGHQLLSLALGARTKKMSFGHHGANHPVLDLVTGKVVITSQNHGFAVADEDLPDNIEVSHRSLFDQTIQGVRALDCPAFSVQYHPEASPGPMDSAYLFDRFLGMVKQRMKD